MMTLRERERERERETQNGRRAHNVLTNRSGRLGHPEYKNGRKVVGGGGGGRKGDMGG